MPVWARVAILDALLLSALQVADEHNLDVSMGMANAPRTAGPSKVKTDEDDMVNRLAELRGK
jgi:hypothetical protein